MTRTADDKWPETLREAHDRHAEMPPEWRDFLLRVTHEACDLAEELCMHPRTAAVGVAGIVGILALTETRGDVNANEQIDNFVEFAYAALHLAVASARLAEGWTPPAPQEAT